MFIAMVNISINAIKFEEITVTFHPRIPSRPIIITTENRQLLIGTIIQINFLKTNHKVAIINYKTPKPKTTISLLMKVIISSAIIGIPPR
jgi:agmatine/peptidylarginine deiminase